MYKCNTVHLTILDSYIFRFYLCYADGKWKFIILLQSISMLYSESRSFRPLSRSPLSRFAHFPVRPWVVSPPYKILFLVLLFRPQKWYKAFKLFFLAYWWFFVIMYKRWNKTEHFIRYFEPSSLRMSTAILIYSQYFASIYRMSFCDTEKAFSIFVRILSISYFCHFLWTHWHFNF